MKLYRWQEAALQIWKNNGCRGIIDAVTGAGKTALAVAAIRYLRETCPALRVRIVVPTIPLAVQWRRTMTREAECGEDVPGFFGGGQKDAADMNVLIYVVNSARDALPRHVRSDLAMGCSVLVVYDECHHYQSRENSRIFAPLSAGDFLTENCFTLGLSATPFRGENDQVLLAGIGPRIYRYGLPQAARDGVISPFIIGRVALDLTPAEAAEYTELSQMLAGVGKKLKTRYPLLREKTGAAFFQAVTALAAADGSEPDGMAAAYLNLVYQRKELCVSASARVDCCAELIGRLHARDRILVFCERIPQAEQTAALIRRRYGDVCGVYHSKLPGAARRRILDSFRMGESRILVACRALDEGIDVPDANVGIVMSCSAVPRQRIQRIGRLLRKAEGKSAACLYYFYIRNSREDPVYLREAEDAPSFALRYDPSDGSFSDALYEYAARELLAEAKARRAAPETLREMRLCLAEGLGRADHLADALAQEAARRAARNRHTKNYWYLMQQIKQLTEGDANHEL